MLGTAAYMSPEQARGLPADKRSDIWAFGCVLYEMLTARRAFAGNTVPETVAAVLTNEPDWRATARDHTAHRQSRPSTLSAEGPETTRAGYRRRGSGIGGRICRARSSGAGHGWTSHELASLPCPRGGAAGGNERDSRGGVVRYPAAAPAPGPDGSDDVGSIGVAGQRLQPRPGDHAGWFPDRVSRPGAIACARAGHARTHRDLSGLGAPRGVFVSPDGQWVGFFDGNTLLKKVAITGGSPLTLCTVDGFGSRGAAWGPDGTIIYATNRATNGLQRVSAAGGSPTPLTNPDPARGEGDHLWPEFLPGGGAVLFTITAPTGGVEKAQIAVLDLKTGSYKVLIQGGSHAHYVQTGHLVYGAGGTVRAVPFDLDRLEVTGAPVGVLEHVVTTSAGALDLVVAVNGTMVYVPGGVAGAAGSLVWVDRSGREEPLATPVRAYTYPRIAPDGTRLAVDIRDRERHVWTWDFARRALTRLTFDSSSDNYPAWSPDSRRLVAASEHSGDLESLLAAGRWHRRGRAPFRKREHPLGVCGLAGWDAPRLRRNPSIDGAGHHGDAAAAAGARAAADPDDVQRIECGIRARRPLAGLRIQRIRPRGGLRAPLPQR